MVNNPVTVAMEIENGLELKDYTNTEILMYDLTLSQPSSWIDSKIFKVDEISIKEAEDDICFYAKDVFDSSPLVSLIGLRYPVDKNAIEWEKRKVEYTPATFLQTNFQDLLKMCIYLWISNKILSKRMDCLQDIAVQKISIRVHE